MLSAKEIPPGGEGKIEVTYKTGSRAGKKTQAVTVFSDDPEQKTVRIKIILDIKALLAIKPTRILFGNLRKSDRYPTKYLSFIGADKDKANVISVKSSNKNIKVEIVPAGDANSNQVKVSVLSGMAIGGFRGRINIKTDHKKNRDFVVNVMGKVVGNISISRKTLSFGMFRPGAKYERSIVLKALPGTSFKMLDVKTTVPGLQTKVETKNEGIVYRLVGFIEKDFSGDSLNGEILVTTDDELQKNIKIVVSGRAFKGKKAKKSVGGRTDEKK